jgi:hypothetical protein
VTAGPGREKPSDGSVRGSTSTLRLTLRAPHATPALNAPVTHQPPNDNRPAWRPARRFLAAFGTLPVLCLRGTRTRPIPHQICDCASRNVLPALTVAARCVKRSDSLRPRRMSDNDSAPFAGHTNRRERRGRSRSLNTTAPGADSAASQSRAPIGRSSSHRHAPPQEALPRAALLHSRGRGRSSTNRPPHRSPARPLAACSGHRSGSSLS